MTPQAALRDASIPTLLACLAQLTGDRRWIEPPYRPPRDVALFPEPGGGLPQAIQDEVRHAAAALMDAIGNGSFRPAQAPDDAFLRDIMCALLAEDVPPEYVPMAREEMGLSDRAVPAPTQRSAPEGWPQVLIIGAGLSGICAAVRLRQMGIACRIFEKEADLGGTWRHNAYPEAGVDTPNHFYSYSFQPNLDWSHNYSKREEVWRYVRDTAHAHGLESSIRFGTEVLAMDWDAEARQWSVQCRDADGRDWSTQAPVVITAVGQLNRPKMAPFPGMETFTGRWWHSAQWPADAKLAGKHVAVIGTGASAMQFLRSVAAEADKVTVFQRSPQWARPDPAYHGRVSEGMRWLLQHMPHYYAWYRFGLVWRFGDGLLRTLRRDPDWPHPERAVNRRNDRHRQAMTDYLLSELEGRPDLVEKCLPDYPPYGKRILVDNGWYRALRRDNVELLTEGVARVEGQEVVTESGERIAPDIIVLATGFEAGKMLAPMDIRGRSGKSLREYWGDDDPRAYLGTTVADFPNLFVLLGPNTGLAHGGSAIFMSECQVRYVCGCLKAMIEQGIAAIEVRQSVQDDYCARVDAEHAELVWTHPGMRNWYRNDRGRVFSPVPWRLVDFRALTLVPDFAEYHLTPLSQPCVASA